MRRIIGNLIDQSESVLDADGQPLRLGDHAIYINQGFECKITRIYHTIILNAKIEVTQANGTMFTPGELYTIYSKLLRKVIQP